jgi:ElaB/YqjD/DUF883 family membrane-anchored ribosome-binding protein
MDKMMADKDVASEIVDIRIKLGAQESKIEHQSKTLDKMSTILERVVILSEKQSQSENKVDELKGYVKTELEKLSLRVHENEKKLMYYSGGLAVFVFIAGVLIKQ